MAVRCSWRQLWDSIEPGDAELRADVERLIDATGAVLSDDERRVLRAVVSGLMQDELKGASQLAVETGLSLAAVEKTCDALLEKRLIGPRPRPWQLK